MSKNDLIEIIRHQNEVITALAEHVHHAHDCDGDDDTFTCGLTHVLAIVRANRGERLGVH